MPTLSGALARAGRVFANRIAVADPVSEFTWAAHVGRVARAAGLLRGKGLRPGERFGIIGLNSFRYTEMLHAGYWSGCVPVPVNHRLAPREMRQILDDSGCRFLVHCGAFAKLLAGGELASFKSGALDLDGACEAMLADTTPIAPHPTRADDLALLLFTGGTTGRSKGVRLSHANLLANAMQVALAMRAGPEDRFLHAAPMFHAADLLGTTMTLMGGSHAYLPSFSPDGLLRTLQDRKVTIAMLVPTMIILALQEPGLAAYDLSHLRLVFYGSSPMDAVWVRRAMEGFPSAELQGSYGLTETSPILTTLDPADHRRALSEGREDLLRAVGRPVAGVDLTIRDDNGNEVAAGAVGEVAVRGPNVSDGYFERPEETAASFRNGWFHTGDMGFLDGDGILHLVDRKKDMVITGGENVYTTEVEAALYQHPNVLEAAVIGVPDAKYGEALFAIVVPVNGKDLSADELIAHCRGRIGAYKIPRRVAFVDELPKSAMGKILKTELRRTYAGHETKF